MMLHLYTRVARQHVADMLNGSESDPLWHDKQSPITSFCVPAHINTSATLLAVLGSLVTSLPLVEIVRQQRPRLSKYGITSHTFQAACDHSGDMNW